MHLSVLVVYGDILLQAGRDSMVVNDCLRLAGKRVDNDLEDIEQFARVSAALAEQRVSLDDADIPLFKYGVSLQGPVQENLQVSGFKRLKHKDLATRQKGRDNLERWVLGGGADEHYRAILDRSEQRVLLCLVEAMDLVDEEDGGEGMRKEGTAAGAVDDVAHVLHASTYSRQREELAVESLRDDVGESGLADTGRTPEDERGQSSVLDHVPEDATGADKVPLADIIVQGTGPHTLRKGREHGTPADYILFFYHLTLFSMNQCLNKSVKKYNIFVNHYFSLN